MELKCCSSVITLEREGFLLQNDCQKPLIDFSIIHESNSGKQKQASYKHSSHVVRTFEVFHLLRNDEVLCDIKLETDDGTIVYGHKVILASATPYFHTMFTNSEESNKEHVILHEVNSTALKLLVDFIYTAQITVTEDNVQDLFHVANLLQLHDVKEACCNFIQILLNPKNCLGLKALAPFYGCEKLLSCVESYIRQNFSEVIESDEFLCLPYEQVVELISCDTLNISSEEKIFECVISWMNHNSDCKNDILLKLLEHVRLPLTSKEYLLNRVKKEPLLKNSLECKEYIIEALDYHLLKYEQPNIIPKTIRTRPRQPFYSNKYILAIGYDPNESSFSEESFISTEWYDPVIKKWMLGQKISVSLYNPTIAALNYRLLFLLNYNALNPNEFYTLDLFSQPSSLKKLESMLIYQKFPGFGVIDNCIYMVGGLTKQNSICNYGQVFNCITQTWKMISDMSTERCSLSVGVLNNHLYAVGGIGKNDFVLNSVERYCPTRFGWTPVKNMHIRRSLAGVGVLNGGMYAVGGEGDREIILKSVEVYDPSSNVWNLVSDMHISRIQPAVVALDGLLYVVGGDNAASVEIYNPKTNKWSMLSATMNTIKNSIGAFAKDITPDFNT